MEKINELWYNVVKITTKGVLFMANTITTPISVRFSPELNSLLTAAVEENETTKTDFIRQAVAEKIENMYDIKVADEAHREWVKGGKKTISHEEMMKKYG